MASGNPTLNEKRFADAFAEVEAAYRAPSHTGTRPRTLDLDGVVTKSGLLLALLVASGAVGWSLVDRSPSTGELEIPGWFFLPMLAGLGLAIWTAFQPKVARFTGPAYALAMGLVVGVLSRAYEESFDGIVLQAVALTVGVFVMMLGLYASRLVRVTQGFRRGVIAATGAIFLVYMANLVLRLFGSEVPFLHDGGFGGIVISLVIVGVAALNLMLDFDFIEHAQGRAPASMEWYAAFGLLVTLVWLYLELLRLLAKLRD